MITDRQEYGLLSHSNKRWISDSIGDNISNEELSTSQIYPLYLHRYFLRSGQVYDNPYLRDRWAGIDVERELADSLYPRDISNNIIEADTESLRETGNLRITISDDPQKQDVLSNYLSIYLDIRTGYLRCGRAWTTQYSPTIEINYKGELIIKDLF